MSPCAVDILDRNPSDFSHAGYSFEWNTFDPIAEFQSATPVPAGRVVCIQSLDIQILDGELATTGEIIIAQIRVVSAVHGTTTFELQLTTNGSWRQEFRHWAEPVPFTLEEGDTIEFWAEVPAAIGAFNDVFIQFNAWATEYDDDAS